MWQRLFLSLVSVVLLWSPSSSEAATPTVSEVLETYRANRWRLDPLHVQLHHTNEYTDAYRARYRLAAERQELMLKGVREMKREDFKKLNPQLPPGYTLDFLISQTKEQLDFNQSMAKQSDHESFVELFQKGEAYQIRKPTHLDSRTPTEWVFPTEPLTEISLKTTYKDMSFFAWSPQLTPHGKIMNGSQPWYTQVTAKHYDSNGARPIPAYSSFAVSGSHDCHPIDAFFHQSPENYKITGNEAIDGRELLVVEVPVPMEFFGGYTRPNGESYQLRTIHYNIAWLDMTRGALPVKLHLWRGNEETKLATLSQRLPDRIMTTDEIREVLPGCWYPTLTVLEQFERDAEKMPKAPQSQEGDEWEKYTTEVAKVPCVVHEREIWLCELVEVPASLADDFFLLPVPKGTEILDRDRQELKQDLFGDLPIDELTDFAKSAGKIWLWGPLSALQTLSDDE